jgi:hypothetical protein
MYDLPVEKRRFLLKLLENAKINEKEAAERAQSKSGTVHGDTPYVGPERYNDINYKIPKKK